MYPGEVEADIPCSIEFEGEYFFIIYARCTCCSKKYCLFDDDFHGWNGWICHNYDKDLLPRPSLVEWKCSHCSSTKHKVVIIVNSQGKQDFIWEAGEDYDVNRWQDAFDWITFDIRCVECSKITKEFISHECM